MDRGRWRWAEADGGGEMRLYHDTRSQVALLEGGVLLMRIVWRVHMQEGKEWMMHIAMDRLIVDMSRGIDDFFVDLVSEVH